MEEKEILLKTIEGLNASIASLSTTNKNQSEQIKNLQERIKELTAQVAWLNRQLFGRKSEKLRVYDPNMPDLFADEFSGLRQQAEEKRDEAVEKIEKESVEDVKRNRQNRKMIEDLPVLETDTIEPKGVDLSLYRRIGEEITKVVKHKPGMLYVKVIIRPKYALKDSTLLPPAGQKGVEIAPMPLMPVDKCIADTSLLDVPQFEGVLIHRGNSAEDSAGCILVGENKVKGKVINSTPYEERLVALCKAALAGGETIEIEVV